MTTKRFIEVRGVVCGSAIERPHLAGPHEYLCWCKPAVIECYCSEDHGPVYGHSCVEVAPDIRSRMAMFNAPGI